MTPRLAGRAGAGTLIAATTLALAGCGGVGGKLTFSDVEKAKITDIVLEGSSGDLVVRTSAITETRITRVVRNSTDPKQSYRLEGTALHLDTDCGPACTVSYEIEAPAGVAVRGRLTSGDINLNDIGATDLTVTSGDIRVQGASGVVKATTNSGDVTVSDAKAGAMLRVNSGDLHAVHITGGPVDAKVGSGDLTVELASAASVTAQSTSGDVQVTVPAGRYQVRTQNDSGGIHLGAITSDPSAKNVLDLRVGSGDLTVATT